MNKVRKVKNEFLLCLFLGWLGAHRFYRKQPLIGILYLFTLGIAGVGWFIDTVILLVELVKSRSTLPITQPILNHEAATFQSTVKQDHKPEQRENLLENRIPVAVLSLTNLKKYNHVELIEVGHQLEIEEDFSENGDPFYLFSSGGFKLGEAEEESMERMKASGIDNVMDAIYIVSEVDQYEYRCQVAVFPKKAK